MTDRDREIIGEYFNKKTNREILAMLSPGTRLLNINWYARSKGWKKPEWLKKLRRYTSDQARIIIENYSDIDNDELLKMIGETDRKKLVEFARCEGLKKSPEFLAAYREEKGRELGLKHLRKKFEETEEYKLLTEKIKKEYPFTLLTIAEYAESIGVPFRKVQRVIAGNHIGKDPQVKKQIYANRAKKVHARKKGISVEENEDHTVRKGKTEKLQEQKEEKAAERKADKPIYRPERDVNAIIKFGKPKSKERCIGNKCACYRLCSHMRGFKGDWCDSYLSLDFVCEAQREAWIEGRF